MAIAQGIVAFYREKAGKKPGTTSYQLVLAPTYAAAFDPDFKGQWYYGNEPLLPAGVFPQKGQACTVNYEQKGNFAVIVKGGFVVTKDASADLSPYYPDSATKGTPTASTPTTYTEQQQAYEKRRLLSVCMKEATILVGMMAAAGAAGVKTLVSADKHAIKLAQFHKKITDELYFANQHLPTREEDEVVVDASEVNETERGALDDDIPF